VDGYAAVEAGLADEFSSSATALSTAVRRAREFASGERARSPKHWDGIAGTQSAELSAVLARPEVREILACAAPDKERAADLRTARMAAAREALLAMRHGYEHGFASGLENDARIFGKVTASPGGQEWVGRFLKKDPLQSSFLELLPAGER